MKKELAGIELHTTGSSVSANSMGMREMQARWTKKLTNSMSSLKSPPASGKSRACEFITLKKLNEGQVQKAIIAIPERSIAKSYHPRQTHKMGISLGLGRLFSIRSLPSWRRSGESQRIRAFY